MTKILRIVQGYFGTAVSMEVNTTMTTHAHSRANLNFWLSGQPAKLFVGDTQVGFDAGRATVISNFVPHRLHVEASSTPASALSFYLDREWLQRRLDERHIESFTVLDVALNSSTAVELRELADEILSDHLRRTNLQTGICEFLERIVASATESSAGYEIAATSPRDFRLNRALKLMRENLDREDCLQDIAKQSGLSRAHFFAVFRAHMGLPPGLFWNALRLELALEQMDNVDKSLTRVASDLGFDIQANFTRFFRKSTGVPPSNYRRALRNKIVFPVPRPPARSMNTKGHST